MHAHAWPPAQAELPIPPSPSPPPPRSTQTSWNIPYNLLEKRCGGRLKKALLTGSILQTVPSPRGINHAAAAAYQSFFTSIGH